MLTARRLVLDFQHKWNENWKIKERTTKEDTLEEVCTEELNVLRCINAIINGKMTGGLQVEDHKSLTLE